MSELTLKKITDRAGTGRPNLSQGFKQSGTLDTTLVPSRTESGTAPTSPSNGDTWYDTANGTYDIYVNNAWQRSIVPVDYTLDPTAFTYDSVSLTVTGASGLEFSTDGSLLFVLASGAVRTYSLSTAWDISTATTLRTNNIHATITTWQSLRFSPDGTLLTTINNPAHDIHTFTLSTAWDMSTISSSSSSVDLSSTTTTLQAIEWNNDGSKMYAYWAAAGEVMTLNAPNAYSANGMTYVGSAGPVGSNTDQLDLRFNADGTQLFSGYWFDIHEYDLSTAYDVTTATDPDVAYNVSTAAHSWCRWFAFSADNTKLYTLRASGGYTLFQHSTNL